jgi:CRISPR system Cascade subunit CasE
MREVSIQLPALPHNRYALHEMAYAFMLGEGSDKTRDFLFAIDEAAPGIVIRSDNLPDTVAQHADDVALPVEGCTYRFVLTAHPTRCIRVDQRNGGQRGKRVMLRRGDDEGRMDWLKARGLKHGFVVEQVALRTEFRHVMRNEAKIGKDGLDFTTFTGALRVTDADALTDAMKIGIGPAKSYGMGMLRLFPA